MTSGHRIGDVAEMTVMIEYCVPCGHLERAIGVQRELLRRYGRQLHAVTLRTGQGGVFKISVDGQLVADAAVDGFDMDAVTAAVERRLVA